MGEVTTPDGLYKPSFQEVGWDAELNTNMDIIQAKLTELGAGGGSASALVRNVKDYGAVGDGVADDTAAIKAAYESTPYYEIGPGFPAPGGWPNQVGGFKAVPQGLQGGIGGIVYFPPGVYLHSETLEPDLRGGTPGGQAARKTISFLGSGYESSRLKWIGPDDLPQLVLGTNGQGLFDNGGNAGGSDNSGFIARMAFDGQLSAVHNVMLVETYQIVVDHCGFGGTRKEGLLLTPDALSGNDYGSINAVVRNCFFGYTGRHYETALRAKDPHVLRVLDNEFGNSGSIRGNLWVGAGGGNGCLIQGNSFEGMFELSGRDLTTADSTLFDAGGGGGLDPYGQPIWDDADGGNHSVRIDMNSGVNVLANAIEDGLGSDATRVREAKHIYIGGTTNVNIAYNNFLGAGVTSNYNIYVDHPGDEIRIENNMVGARVATVLVNTDVLEPWIYEANNYGFTVDLTDVEQDKISHGPHKYFRGFSPKLVVGDWGDAVGNPSALTGILSKIRGTLDVRGELVSEGVRTGIVGGRSPVDADLAHVADGTIRVRGKVSPPGSGTYTAALSDPPVPGSLNNDRFFWFVTFVTLLGETDTLGVCQLEVFDNTVNGTAVVQIPLGPPGTTARKLYRRSQTNTTYYLRATIADNTTTSFTDSMSDATLAGNPAGLPLTNTTDDRDHLFVRTAGVQRFVDLDSTRRLTGTVTWNPPSVSAGAQTTTTITIAVASVGDPVSVGFDKDLQGMQLTGYVSAANTVTVVLRNGTTGAIDLANGTLRADVAHH